MKIKKYIRKLLYFVSRKVIRYFVTFALILSILTGSLFSSFYTVRSEASMIGAAQAVGLIGSLLGIANIASDGGVSSMSGSIADHIRDWWGTYTGNGGISVDNDGNYVFSGTATQALYDGLNTNSGTDAKVVSYFPFNIDKKYSSSFVTPLNSWVANNNIDKNNILRVYTYYFNGSSYYNRMCYFDLSNVAFIQCSHTNGRYYYYFIDSSLSRTNVQARCASQVVTNNDAGPVSDWGITNCKFFALTDDRDANTTTSMGVNTMYWSGYSSVNNDAFYLNFPFNCVSSSRSLILAKTVLAGDSISHGGAGTYIANYYPVLPSIPASVVEQNNWDNCYNNFIQNINNNQENYIDNSGNVDWQKLRDEIAKWSGTIMQAIEEGNTEIADKINYTNEWLKKIYVLLKEIRTLIAQNEGGSSDPVDLSQLEGDLHRVLLGIDNIESDVHDISLKLNTLQQEYTILSNIYNYMLSHPWGGSGGPFITPTQDPYGPWFDLLDDDDGTLWDELIDKWDILKALLSATMPVVLFTSLGVIANSFSATPVEPVFNIPFTINSFGIDEDIEIDLTVYDDLIVVLRALIVILWVVGLAVFTWWLMPKLVIIFQL